MTSFYKTLVVDVCQSGLKTGDVGIEIELETKNDGFNWPAIVGWATHSDGSLKNNGCEYVTKSPISFDKVQTYVNRVFDTLKGQNFEMFESMRASTHIHINMQNRTLEQVYKFIACYLIVEDTMVRWCGENRVGNLFCLRAKDAEGLVEKIRGSIKNQSLGDIATNDIKYSSLNPNSLVRFGSLEFRALQTKEGGNNILPWVEVLLNIRAESEKLSWFEIIEKFSYYGPEGFARKLIGERYEEVTHGQGDLEDGLISGMRLAQDLIFQRSM